MRSLQKGTLDDFKGIQLDATQKASIPIYVKVKVTNLGPGTIDVDATSAAIEGIDKIAYTGTDAYISSPVTWAAG